MKINVTENDSKISSSTLSIHKLIDVYILNKSFSIISLNVTAILPMSCSNTLHTIEIVLLYYYITCANKKSKPFTYYTDCEQRFKRCL